MKKTFTVKSIATAGVLSAVAVILGITPFGIIPWFSGTSITIMHVPVIIAAILEGPLVGAVVGLIFGLTSMIRATVSPTGILDPYFANPLISVLPRILIGLVTWLVYRALKKWPIPAVITACIVGSFTNTFLVVGSLGLFANINWEEMLGIGFMPLFGTIIVANGIPEALGATIIGFAVIMSWKKIETRTKGASLDSIEED